MEKSLSDPALPVKAPTPRFVHARSSDAVVGKEQLDGREARDGRDDGDIDPGVVEPLLIHHRQDDSSESVSEPAVCSSRSFASEISSLAPSSPEPLPPEESSDASSASIWSRPEHKVAAFVVLLVEEFLVAYEFSKTAQALKDELIEQKLGFPSSSSELWCEMYHSCRAVLARSGTSNSTSTIEKLVEFCSNASTTRKKGFALELMHQHQSYAGSPVSVCASPKKTSVSKKSSQAFSLMDAHVQMLRSPLVVRPSRRVSGSSMESSSAAASVTAATSPFVRDASSASLEGSASAPVLATTAPASTVSRETETAADPGLPLRMATITLKKAKKKRRHGLGDGAIPAAAAAARHHNHHHHPESYYYQSDKPHTNGHFGGTQTNVAVHASFEQRTATPGSYVEPALVLAHEAQLKRDLASVRILERELRHIRLEKIAVEPKRALVKRLGFASMSKTESQHLRAKQDPYLNDLVMEKLGFSKRFECALCQFSFLQVNLPHKVSFKCIMDVYSTWQYEPPDKEYATKYRAPLCYDPVHVCRMCAQIVLAHTSTTMSAVNGHSFELETTTTARRSKPPQQQHQLARDESFCSDPYALPPLFADDCYDEHDALHRSEDAHDDARNNMLVESPAKAIVYANQSNELSHFMTSKEWEVINPQRSSIREAIEGTLRQTLAAPTLAKALAGAVATAGTAAVRKSTSTKPHK